MQRLALFLGVLTMLFAAASAYLGASLMADHVETLSRRSVETAISDGDAGWVSVRTDGLRVILSGAAPSEPARFGALTSARTAVSAKRVEDAILVVDPEDLLPPQFSLELLRNGDGVSLIGLVPEAMGRDYVLEATRGIGAKTHVTDMLETADHKQPEGWRDAVDFALASLVSLPRSKISVAPGRVSITALTDSPEEKTATESRLEKARPAGVSLDLGISAPRPVITPFTLRLIKDELGVRFDSCSADSAQTAARILSAARSLGLAGDADCAIGLGAPSPRWADAVELALAAVGGLDGGTVTFSDADVTLIAPETTPQDDFDRIVHDLEKSLPDVFSVHAVLPPRLAASSETTAGTAPEFLVTKSPEGLVRMRGRMRDERTRLAVAGFADALFGAANVDNTTRTDAATPDGWPLRVMAGLEALSRLRNGLLRVEPEVLELKGTADRPEARTEVTQILSEKLGDASLFRMDVTYVEALDRREEKPTPEDCVMRINAILKEKQIVFAPSSSKIDAKSMDVVQKIADALTDCADVAMEIGGHTDSQGRESMNLTLSQSRAEAVLDTLLSLEVLTTNLSAKGFGESRPIADNKTEEGRRANRRIEFKLIEKPGAKADKTDQAGTTEKAGKAGKANAQSAKKPPAEKSEKDKTPGKPKKEGSEPDGQN